MIRLLVAAVGVLGVLCILAVAQGASSGSDPGSSCFVGDDQIDKDVMAPADLEFDYVFFPGGFWYLLNWDDRSAEETCYVVERGQGTSSVIDFAPVATLGPNSHCLIDASDVIATKGVITFYRVYAATASARSHYSNTAGISAPTKPGLLTPNPPTPFPECGFLQQTATPPPTPTQGPPTPTVSAKAGDIDCDGDVDSVDALLILRFVAAMDESLSDC